jgi:hypothetical protein
MGQSRPLSRDTGKCKTIQEARDFAVALQEQVQDVTTWIW